MVHSVQKELTKNSQKALTDTDLFDLWFTAEELRSTEVTTPDDLEEIESQRDLMLDKQTEIARQILVRKSVSLRHVFLKLKLWEAAYGPPIGTTLEEGWDIYNLMVVSAMRDLETLIGEDGTE